MEFVRKENPQKRANLTADGAGMEYAVSANYSLVLGYPVRIVNRHVEMGYVKGASPRQAAQRIA